MAEVILTCFVEEDDMVPNLKVVRQVIPMGVVVVVKEEILLVAVHVGRYFVLVPVHVNHLVVLNAQVLNIVLPDYIEVEESKIDV